MQKNDHVGILLDGSGLAEVAHHRTLVRALLRATVQLGDRDDGHLELLREELEGTRELRDLLLAGLDALAGRHELQVVDDHELQVVPLLEPPALCPDLHEGHVRRVVDEQRRFGDSAHRGRELLPVVLAHLTRAQLLQVDLRLGREQSHRDLVAAHLEREDNGRLSVLDGRRTDNIDSESRVVGRHHCAAGQVQVLRVIDLHAPDGDAVDRLDGHDVPLAEPRGRRAATILVDQPLPLEREDVVVGREGQGVRDRGLVSSAPDDPRGPPRAVPERVDELTHVVGQAPAGQGDLRAARRVDGAVGVEKPREQLAPLSLAGPQVLRRDVLVVHDPERTEDARDGAVVIPARLASTQAGAWHPAVRARRGRDRRRHHRGAAPARLSAGPDLAGARDERVAADHALARCDLVGLGEPQAVEPGSTRRRTLLARDESQALDPHRDLGVGRREPCRGGVSVAQPDTERVRHEGQVGVGQVERGSDVDGVVGPTISRGAVQRRRKLLSRTDRGGPAAGQTPHGTGSGRPLVLGVRDDLRPVVERHSVAGAVHHDLRHCYDEGRRPVGGDELVADLDVAHRRPAGGGRERCVEREGLADGGTRGNDNHLSGVQPVRQPVQVREPRRHPDHAHPAVPRRLDLVDGTADDVAEPVVVLGRAPLGDRVHLGLRVVDDVVDVAAVGRVAELDDARASLDEAAQDGPLAHDPRVVPRVGGGRHHGDEGVEVGRPADAGHLAALGQLVGDGDRVRGLATAVQVEDRVVDRLVRRAVEVVAAQLLDDVGDGVLRDHHAAEDALLGGDVLRRGPVELAGAARPRRHAVLELFDRHRPIPASTSTYRTLVLPGGSDTLRDRAPGEVRRPAYADVENGPGVPSTTPTRTPTRG